MIRALQGSTGRLQTIGSQSMSGTRTQNNLKATAERKLWAALMHAWNNGHTACQLEIASEYTSKYPKELWGWVALADVLVSMADYKGARRALSRADRLASQDERIREHICLQWGHLCKGSYDLNGAARWYRRALEYKARTSTLVFLGAVLAKRGQFAEAKRCHRRAIRVATDLVADSPDEAYYNLGLILRAERQYAQALECFKQAIKIDPKQKEYAIAHKDVLNVLEFRKKR